MSDPTIPEYILLTAAWCPTCHTAQVAITASGLSCWVIYVETQDDAERAMIAWLRPHSLPMLAKMIGGRIWEQWTGTQINKELCERLKREVEADG